MLAACRGAAQAATLAIARAQEPDGGQIRQLVGGPQPFPREKPFGEAVNQANEIQLVRHGRELAADGLRGENESTIKHTILLSRHSRFQRAIARRWGPPAICFRRCRQTRRWYQIEGALERVFEGMRKLSVRCVVTAGKPGPGHRLPFVGPEPGCRTRQEEHALSIITDQFRSAIPQRGARQHCPLPLHRHGQHKTIAQSEGTIYHRTVNSALTVCLTGGAHPIFLLFRRNEL